MIKTLWHITIFGFLLDFLLSAAYPIYIWSQGNRFAWYLWLWMITPLVYVPYIAWYTCEMIFSYYRILDMGGTGTEFASPADLEALLLPDKKPSTMIAWATLFTPYIEVDTTQVIIIAPFKFFWSGSNIWSNESPLSIQSCPYITYFLFSPFMRQSCCLHRRYHRFQSPPKF